VIKILRQSGRVLWRAFMRFQDHNGPDRAAAVAYYTLLSLLPLLIFLISIGVAVVGSFDVAYQGTLYLIRGMVIHMDQKTMDELRSFVEHALRRAFLCNRLQSALSTSDRTPAAILRPVWACTLKGCRIKPRREPPIRALAPMP